LDAIDRKSNEIKQSSFLFRKKEEIIKQKSDVTYEQFMKRSFFASDNADDEIESYFTGIGKDIPQNIMHLKGILVLVAILKLINSYYY